MNRKQFIILLVLVAVIGGAGLVIYKNNSESYQGATRVGAKLLGDFDVNDVAEVSIQQGNQTANLARNGDIWVVKERNNYPANFDQISDLVRKLHDLKVVQTMPVAPAQLSKFELAEGSGANAATVVQLKNASGKSLKKLLLGAKLMRKSEAQSAFGGDEGYATGRYVLVENSQTVASISDPLSNAEPKPEHWLNKDFVKIENVSAVSLVAQDATNSWQISRATETGEWKLADAKSTEQFDTNKAPSIANSFAYAIFNDVATNTKPEQTGLDKPTVATMETFDKFKYTLKIGKKSADDNVFMTLAISADLPKERNFSKDEKPEDKEKLDKEFKEKSEKLAEKLKQQKQLENWVYLVPDSTIQMLTKKRAELMVEKSEKPETDNHHAPALSKD